MIREWAVRQGSHQLTGIYGTSSITVDGIPSFPSFRRHLPTRYVNVGQNDKEVSILLRALPETKGE